MSRRVLRGVLGNFLGTYTSRYTDYDGYWLFGFLVDGLGTLDVDLLAPPTDGDAPADVARRRAREKFREQMLRAGLSVDVLREARLLIEKLPGDVTRPVGSRPTAGHRVRFLVHATTDLGRRYDHETVLFAAPHDARHERQSSRRA